MGWFCCFCCLKPGMENAPLFRSFSERMKRMKEQAQVNAIYIATPDRNHIILIRTFDPYRTTLAPIGFTSSGDERSF